MTVTVNMSKEEFLDYCNDKNFKSQLKCSIIDLKDNYNALLKLLLEDGIWTDRNKYGKIIDKLNSNITELERGVKNVDSEMSSKSVQ